MPSQDKGDGEDTSTNVETQLFNAITSKNLGLVKEIFNNSTPNVNLDCLDKDELTPLQHACHIGDLNLARFLLDNGARIDFTHRKDGYTPLMFAAIGARADIVRLLLERGADITLENCVNRTAAQMASFVGQHKIVGIINSWIPYSTSVEPYTKCRELESKPRIPSLALGRILHEYVVFPNLHPVRMLLHIKENIDLLRYASEFIYVLDDLSSKAMKHPKNDDEESLKYYFLSYLLGYSLKTLKAKSTNVPASDSNRPLDDQTMNKVMETTIRKLIKKDDPKDAKQSKQVDLFVIECLLKFPYTQSAIFKTITFALSKFQHAKTTGYDGSGVDVLKQVLNGPKIFGHVEEACCVCEDPDSRNKKCSKCKSAYYCGSACQQIDWFQHKRICKDPEETPLINNDQEFEQG